MELIELSKERLAEENEKLFELIIKDYNYDCVIFIAKGSYLIGKHLSEKNNVPLLEVFAKRHGSKLKKIISPFLKLIPLSFKKYLREKEFNSNYHEKKSDRKIEFDANLWSKYKKVKKILLVDDSIDTGISMKLVKKCVEDYFRDSEVKVATLNYFSKSNRNVKTDYYLYVDSMLKGPWSNDSKENKRFLKEYGEWHENQK